MRAVSSTVEDIAVPEGRSTCAQSVTFDAPEVSVQPPENKGLEADKRDLDIGVSTAGRLRRALSKKPAWVARTTAWGGRAADVDETKDTFSVLEYRQAQQTETARKRSTRKQWKRLRLIHTFGERLNRLTQVEEFDPREAKDLDTEYLIPADRGISSPTRTTADFVIPEHKWMINPHSTRKAYWDFFLLIMVLYTAVVIPWELAFEVSSGCDNDLAVQQEQQGTGTCRSTFLDVMEIFVNVVFMTDIVISFRTGYEDKKMMIHMGARDVAAHYAKSWFFLDICASLPLEAITTSLSSGESSNRQVMILKLFKVLRLLRLGRLLNSAKIAAANTFRIVKLMCGFFLVAHWAACLWYYVGRWQVEEVGSGNAFTGQYTWIQVPLSEDNNATYYNADMRTKYTACIYWAFVTMYTVGYGDIVPVTNFERAFTMAIQLLGCISTALIFGNVALLIMKMDIAGTRLNENVDMVNEFIRFHKIPVNLANRMRKAIEHQFQLYQGLSVAEEIRDLPSSLRTDVLMHLHVHDLRRNPVFGIASDALLKKISTRLTIQSFIADDMIMHEDEAATEMFLISKGKVALVTEDCQRVFSIVRESEMFGDTDLFQGVPRLMAAQAITHVEVYMLKRIDLDEVLRDFPEYIDPFIESVRQRCEDMNDLFTRKSRDSSKFELLKGLSRVSQMKMENDDEERSTAAGIGSFGGQKSRTEQENDEAIAIQQPQVNRLDVTLKTKRSAEQPDTPITARQPAGIGRALSFFDADDTATPSSSSVSPSKQGAAPAMNEISVFSDPEVEPLPFDSPPDPLSKPADATNLPGSVPLRCNEVGRVGGEEDAVEGENEVDDGEGDSRTSDLLKSLVLQHEYQMRVIQTKFYELSAMTEEIANAADRIVASR